ncbi:signal peptidase I [Hamadaea flava]|uniref:S26 family signal peptidase n=1 Tax=Hamadaea flava TaxID=1742688 RepID=A0ABV8LNK2_9ACTN|nr:S26 family signal peptidase [Hamadaea flava]MCP2322881.1 signal peptidase I [Hamadaea flava]
MIAVAAAVVLLLIGLILRARRRHVVVTVVGDSMLPTYHPGDRLLVRRVAPDSVRIRQVIVLSGLSREGWIVKRVAAVPGDPIPRDVPALRTAVGDRVPQGQLVVLGDNPARSHDSRHSGYFGADRLLGVVVRTISAPRARYLSRARPKMGDHSRTDTTVTPGAR